MSHQLRKTSTADYQRHGQLAIGYRSYGNQTSPIKCSFFQAVIVCTIWTLTKRMEEKLDGNYKKKMLRAILNKSWRQRPTKQQLYSHLPPITISIKFRRTRHAGHCWRSKGELKGDVLPRTLSHGRAKAGRPART